MGCPASVILGDDIVFSICTHDPDTGVLTDAESVPTYRIYEGADESSILNGNMDSGTGSSNNEFDDANTTGYYAKLISCTAGNGFEIGKSYTVYIEATVDGDTGGIAYGFNVSRHTYTVAGTMDANVQYINDAEVDGDGTSDNPWGPA